MTPAASPAEGAAGEFPLTGDAGGAPSAPLLAEAWREEVRGMTVLPPPEGGGTEEAALADGGGGANSAPSGADSFFFFLKNPNIVKASKRYLKCGASRLPAIRMGMGKCFAL